MYEEECDGRNLRSLVIESELLMKQNNGVKNAINPKILP